MDLYDIALAKALSGNGEGLPDVEPEDAGKVLTVDEDGNWVAANIPQKESFIVNLEADTSQAPTISLTSNVTFDELVAAYQSNKKIIVRMSGLNYPAESSLTLSVYIDDTTGNIVSIQATSPILTPGSGGWAFVAGLGDKQSGLNWLWNWINVN